MIKLLHCRHWSWINPFVLETKTEHRGAEKQKDSQSEHFKLNKSTASAEDFTCFGSAVVSVPTSSPLPGGQSKDHKVKLNLSAAQFPTVILCSLLLVADSSCLAWQSQESDSFLFSTDEGTKARYSSQNRHNKWLRHLTNIKKKQTHNQY